MVSTEAYLERKFSTLVIAAGGKAVKLVAVEKGTPDRLVLWPGNRLELVELKTETGRLHPIQKAWHKRALERQGVEVKVLYGDKDVEEYVESRKQWKL